MLEFVSLSGEADGKDLQTRRKVRSQAMRDYRRRQRAEREAGKASRLNVASDRSSTSSTMHGNTSTWQAHIPVSSKSLKKDTVSGRRRRTAGANPVAKPVGLADAEYRSNARILSSYAPMIMLGDEEIRPSSASWSHSNPEPENETVPPRRLSSVPRSPPQWGAENDDPFLSPARISQMLRFCTSYIHWLRPGVDPETAAEVLSQAWRRAECPMLLAACCLASVGHLDAVQPNRPGGNYALYKARVLHEVSNRMKSPMSATSDETIRSLACLLSFEMSRCSGEALTHLRGLKGLVNMKGGMEALESPGIGMMLETLDLIHTAMYDAEPVLTCPEPGTSMRPFPDLNENNIETAVSSTPLITLAEQYEYRKSDRPYRKSLEHFPALLESFFRALAYAYLRIDEAASTKAIEEFRRQLDRFGDFESREQDDNEPANAVDLLRVCYIALLMPYNLLAHQIPQRHASNQQYADELFAGVNTIDEKTWEGLAYFRLIALLTGAVASSDLTRRSFFKAQLVRAIYNMGVSEWRRVKRFLLVYVGIKNELEQPARLAVPPLEIDPVQTTDQSYLYVDYARGQSNRSSTSASGSYSSAQAQLLDAARFLCLTTLSGSLDSPPSHPLYTSRADSLRSSSAYYDHESHVDDVAADVAPFLDSYLGSNLDPYLQYNEFTGDAGFDVERGDTERLEENLPNTDGLEHSTSYDPTFGLGLI